MSNSEEAKARTQMMYDQVVHDRVNKLRLNEHKIRRITQYQGACSCGKWQGYFGRYGETSYAVHLAKAVYRARDRLMKTG